MHLARSARVVARGSLQSTLRVRPISSGRRALLPLVAAFSSFSFFGMGNGMSSKARTHELAKPALLPPPPGEERIYIAGGCFWCVEGAFTRMKGVSSAISGYQGGMTENPTYEEICEGDTGHAEVVAVTFNPSVIPLEKVLSVFYTVHDPTTLNRQGNDVGTQYRSAIFYTSEEQKKAVEAFIASSVQPKWSSPVVTQIASAAEHRYYPAEDYHQDYYSRNPEQGYCRAVVSKKVKKAVETFPEQVK